VDAVPIALTRADAGKIAMPVERRAFADLDALLSALVVEEA
jgi:hypothetical protein